MEYDRVRLKRDVKLSMKRSGCMVVTLLFTVVVSVGAWLINMLLGGALTGRLGSWSTMIPVYIQAGYEPEEAVRQALLTLLSMGPGPMFSVIVGGMVLSTLVSLWRSAMNVGYKGWCLGMVRNENPPVSKIFCALPQILQVLVTRFLTGLFELLWSLLVGVGYIVLVVIIAVIGTATELMGLTVILLLAAFAAFVLGAVWVTMRYALVDYVLLDKGLSGMEAIRESKRLMKGNIGRGWVLQASFAGWYLLMIAMVYVGLFLALIPIIGAFASGGSGGWVAASGFALLVLVALSIGTSILSLWLQPYVTGAMAKFYDWANGAENGVQAGPGFGGWGGPADYTWNSGSSGPGTGTGSGSSGGFPPPHPKPPRSPRDDPWD